MITQFDYISPAGAAMTLLHNPFFTVTDIEGLTTETSNLASVSVPSVDGDTVTNVQAQPRTVNMYLRLKQSAGIEAAKRYILQFVKPKLAGTLQMTRDGHQTELKGIVEAISLPRFAQGCTMQITLHCAQPYWTDSEITTKDFSTVENAHHYPLALPSSGIVLGAFDSNNETSVENDGDVETGLQIVITALGAVTNPKLTDALTGEFIGITDTLAANDEVIINTTVGSKTVTKNGANIISKLTEGSRFLQLGVGSNIFAISATSGIDNAYFTVRYRQKYV